MADDIETTKGASIGPLLPLTEGRKRLNDYARDKPHDPSDHTALCREVREMLGDTPEEAECGCREMKK